MAIGQQGSDIAVNATIIISGAGVIPPRSARHQIDAMGTDTGSLAVKCDFGAGLREVGTIDFTDTTRVPFVIEAEIDEIQLVPSSPGAVWDYCYRAEERR